MQIMLLNADENVHYKKIMLRAILKLVQSLIHRFILRFEL